MKILHFSDTHLGYSDLDILNDENINQREADFYDAFSQVIEQIKIIKPDYIIHTGDLFHRSSPSNRAITFALEQIKVIEELNIPFILIAGNHSTPRTNLSSPILKIFENFKNIHVSYKQEYKKVLFDDVVFHTLPHMNDDSKALQQIELCEKNIDKKKKNIMMMHCSVGAGYLMQEFGEWVYPRDKEYIFEMMDYVALGHWHGFGHVGKHTNVYYSGSTERTSLNDKRNSKGFVLIDLKNKLDVQYKEIKIRPIVLKEIHCEYYENSIQNIDSTDTKDAIVEVRLTHLTALQSIDIQNSEIKKLFPEAMSVSIKREFKKGVNEAEVNGVEALSLQEFFLEHLKQDSKTQEYDRLKDKVQELFAQYEEVTDDTL
ncbi:MAG: DNA repair exonuclease [Sulfurimonas sp.]|uniref:metallophosphoesterase family protein n=1 Tax=Sulfurimonas sp. TaxID=2022749 RepID=UPI00260651A4|nr:DNA repair exonuclease [Sulfurimonas sp.]MCW8895060.1 DNA repair exonuclease [Sulfurimonas sp.]MCW8954666.1 DNA repair exonuclease [Sulfurimonas sp.]MCW9068456.1 DNA repair exonuclease [Sulfurimonas sp.]